MTSILSTAINGLNAATARVANAASSIVNASSTPVAGKNAGTDANPGIDADIVGLKIDQVNYSANAAVIKTAQKLEKALLDIKT